MAAEYLWRIQQKNLAHEDFVLRISDKLPLEGVAPLLCAGITTYSPLRHWKVGKGDKVGVLVLVVWVHGCKTCCFFWRRSNDA